MAWLSAYVHGDHPALRDWIIARWPDPESDGYAIPAREAYLGPYWLPREQTGTATDEEGNECPTYGPIAGRSDILCLVAVWVEPQLIELDADGNLVPLEFAEPQVLIDLQTETGATVTYASRTEIPLLYPEHCLGREQAVPHVA